jgi:hypothetical protein
MQAEYERVATPASAEDMVREVVGGEIGFCDSGWKSEG